MARLFITPRELNFISDITKEIIKDVNGQVIYYYPVSELKTKVHDVYNEAMEKIFDQPIAIDALVSAIFQEDTKINKFGVDAQFKLDVYIQYRDLVDKNIEISLGDFFSFSSMFYEITNITVMKNIFGQAEHKAGVKVTGTKVRESQFKAKVLGPTDIANTDDDAIQKTFDQSRGEDPSDKRDLQPVIGKPLTGAKQVSEAGALFDDSHHASSFYGDQPDEGDEKN